ncbi:hypothetical protein [Kordia antarctica]|nr:hypothetical protein [Kordia antarctica]
MKKQKIKSLLLSKKTVSKLTNLPAIKGGGPTHNPTCLEPTGISFCIRCMEDFTEGCVTHPYC